MDTKTRAFFDLAGGVGLLIMAIALLVYFWGLITPYSLFSKADVEGVLQVGVMALFFGFLAGAAITRAYYTLTGKRPYEKKKKST